MEFLPQALFVLCDGVFKFNCQCGILLHIGDLQVNYLRGGSFQVGSHTDGVAKLEFKTGFVVQRLGDKALQRFDSACLAQLGGFSWVGG